MNWILLYVIASWTKKEWGKRLLNVFIANIKNRASMVDRENCIEEAEKNALDNG